MPLIAILHFSFSTRARLTTSPANAVVEPSLASSLCVDCRAEDLQVHARKMSMAPECNLEQVAYDVPGLVGADLANLLNEAAIAAVKEGTKQIFPRHLLVRADVFAFACERALLLSAAHSGLVLHLARDSRTGTPCMRSGNICCT